MQPEMIKQMSNEGLRRIVGDPGRFERFSAATVAMARIELRIRGEERFKGLWVRGWNRKVPT